MPFDEALLEPAPDTTADTPVFDESLLVEETDPRATREARKAALRRQAQYEYTRSGGPLLDLLARHSDSPNLLPPILLPPDAPGSVENVLRRLPLGAGNNATLKENRVKGISSAIRTVAGGFESATAPENLPLLPLAAIPGVAPAMGLYFGSHALNEGARELGEASVTGDPETLGRGVGTALLGGTLAVPAARAKSFLPERFGGGVPARPRTPVEPPAPTTPADVPELAAQLEAGVENAVATPESQRTTPEVTPSPSPVTSVTSKLTTVQAIAEAVRLVGKDELRRRAQALMPPGGKGLTLAGRSTDSLATEWAARQIVTEASAEAVLSPPTIASTNPLDFAAAQKVASDLGLRVQEQPGAGDFPASWQFDYRPSAPEPGFTFQMPEGASAADIAFRLTEKKAQFAAPAAEPAAAPVGMGAMAAGELTPTPRPPTSNKNAIVDAERAARGLPPMEPVMRQTWGSALDEAMSRIEADPNWQDRLIAELRKKPRPLTPVENAALLQRRTDLRNELEKAMREGAEAADDGRLDDAASAKVRADEWSDQLTRLEEATDRGGSGTESGRSLAARKMMMAEDFSLAAMELKKRTARDFEQLTSEERAELVRAHDRIAVLQRKLDEAFADAEAQRKARPRSGKGGGSKPPTPPLTRDVLESGRALEDAQAKWHESLARDRFARLSTPRRLFSHAKNATDLLGRVLVTAYDFSAVLRQGKFIVAGHPLRGARALPDMFRAFASKAAEYRAEKEIASRPNARNGTYRNSGLYLAERDAPLSRAEEAYTANWAKRIPGVAGSQRAYNTFLNRLRADSFDAMASALPRGRTPTPAEATAIAKYINAATGRGSLGALESAAVGLNRLFFAPRYVASRFQLLGGALRVAGEAGTGFRLVSRERRAVRTLIAREYARTLIGYAAFYTLARLALPDSEVETDPRSSDAGKVKIGNTRLDPLAGLQQNTVVLARLGTGETKTLRGRINPIRGEDVPRVGSTAMDVMTRFVRSKLAPWPAAVVNALAGEDVIGRKTTVASTIESLTVPISWQDIAAAIEDQGIPRGTALGLLSIFGEGLQVYEDRDRQR